MRLIRQILVMAVAMAAVGTHASCLDLSKDWFGFSIGPFGPYPNALVPGIKREGTARFIEGVGFESLEGKSKGITFDRIMAFFDRGSFAGFVAIGKISNDPEADLASIGKLVAAYGAVSSGSDGSVSVTCEPGVELSVGTTKWDDGKMRVNVRLMDTVAKKATDDYITEYCADPSRRKPFDACKQ